MPINFRKYVCYMISSPQDCSATSLSDDLAATEEQGDQLFFYENPQKFPKNTPISPIHKIKIPKLSPKSILNEKKIIYISILRPIRNFISLLSIEPFHN